MLPTCFLTPPKNSFDTTSIQSNSSRTSSISRRSYTSPKKSGLKLAIKIYNEMKDTDLMSHTNMAMKGSEIMYLIFVIQMVEIIKRIDQRLLYRNKIHTFKRMLRIKHKYSSPIVKRIRTNHSYSSSECKIEARHDENEKLKILIHQLQIEKAILILTSQFERQSDRFCLDFFGILQITKPSREAKLMKILNNILQRNYQVLFKNLKKKNTLYDNKMKGRMLFIILTKLFSKKIFHFQAQLIGILSSQNGKNRLRYTQFAAQLVYLIKKQNNRYFWKQIHPGQHLKFQQDELREIADRLMGGNPEKPSDMRDAISINSYELLDDKIIPSSKSAQLKKLGSQESINDKQIKKQRYSKIKENVKEFLNQRESSKQSIPNFLQQVEPEIFENKSKFGWLKILMLLVGFAFVISIGCLYLNMN